MFHDIHEAIEARRNGLNVLAARYEGRNIHREIEIRYSKYVTQPGDNGIRQPDLAARRQSGHPARVSPHTDFAWHAGSVSGHPRQCAVDLLSRS